MAFDLDAARAKRHEEALDPFVYTVGGVEYHIPNQKEWPISATDLLAQGKVQEGFRALTEGNGGMPPNLTVGDVNDIMGAAAEFFGLGTLPNS